MWALIMRKDVSPHDAGDFIDIWDDIPGGDTPEMGRTPHTDTEYGSAHSIIHVLGLTRLAAEKYLGQQFDSNGIGYLDTENPFRLPTIKPRMWKLDVDLMPVGNRANLKGNKIKLFQDRYDVGFDNGRPDGATGKSKQGAFDMEMNRAEFDNWMVQKPVPEGRVIT